MLMPSNFSPAAKRNGHGRAPHARVSMEPFDSTEWTEDVIVGKKKKKENITTKLNAILIVKLKKLTILLISGNWDCLINFDGDLAVVLELFQSIHFHNLEGWTPSATWKGKISIF